MSNLRNHNFIGSGKEVSSSKKEGGWSFSYGGMSSEKGLAEF